MKILLHAETRWCSLSDTKKLIKIKIRGIKDSKMNKTQKDRHFSEKIKNIIQRWTILLFIRKKKKTGTSI